MQPQKSTLSRHQTQLSQNKRNIEASQFWFSNSCLPNSPLKCLFITACFSFRSLSLVFFLLLFLLLLFFFFFKSELSAGFEQESLSSFRFSNLHRLIFAFPFSIFTLLFIFPRDFLFQYQCLTLSSSLAVLLSL